MLSARNANRDWAIHVQSSSYG